MTLMHYPNVWRSLFEDDVKWARPAADYQVPAVDVVENEENFVVYADMPGVSKENISVSVEKGVLRIAGKYEKQAAQGESTVRKSERLLRSYQRDFTLNDTIDTDAIDASYDNGVLVVTLPKQAEQVNARQISIN